MKQPKVEDKILDSVKRIHMIGIGGSGMCPIAEILSSKGYIISGSDNNESDPLKRVINMGAKVYMGHDAKNIEGAELIIYSAAISADNPELCAAREQCIPTMERSHVLGALTRKYDNVIGVCGTHGKTTVSSMITQILILNNLNPTAVIGGRLPLINSNGICGTSEHMVCESCEFVDTFLQLSPDTAVLLNIDNDHLDYFKTMDNLVASFNKFLKMAKKVFVNGDDALALKASDAILAEKITFGLNSNCNYTAQNLKSGKFGYSFDACFGGEKIITIDLKIPGKHNVYNALAAFAVAHNMGVAPIGIKEALLEFTGAGRRFEFLGDFSNGLVLADDYAHHPTEINATLTAAKDLPYKRVTVVFQPFTFSRTALLFDDFVNALSIADRVVLTPIMGSREKNEYNISSEMIAEKLENAVCLQTFTDVADYIVKTAIDGDLVITMGGGDIYKAAYIIRERLKD